MGRVRLLDAGRHRFLAVADAPLERYGEDAINRGLSDLDWVARAAVAHEAVVESFIGASAVVPMKLFTIFTSDERAVEHVRREAPLVEAVIRRVANHHEWGVRIVLDRPRVEPAAAKKDRSTVAPGKIFLAHKKAQRDAAAELVRHARDTVADVYDRLAERSSLSKRRAASELPIQDGPLVLDAAFLIPVKGTARFRKLADREARTLAQHGYRLTVSGPWPPYSFIQD